MDAAQNGLPPTIVAQWGAIVQKLAELLTTLKGNHVPSFLCRKIYTQVFAYINVQLFNRWVDGWMGGWVDGWMGGPLLPAR